MSLGRPEIVDRLREATREQHAETQDLAPAVQGSLARYRWFVAGQYGFAAPLEPRLPAAPGMASTGLDLERRRRAHLLAADLLHLGVHPGMVPRCESLPRVDSAARALGALYVLEGSTLWRCLQDLDQRRVFRRDAAPTDVVSCARPYEEYFASLSKNFRGNLRKARNKLAQLADGRRTTCSATPS